VFGLEHSISLFFFNSPSPLFTSLHTHPTFIGTPPFTQTAPFRLIREAAPFMRDAGKKEMEAGKKPENRCIINVSSTSGLHGNIGQVRVCVCAPRTLLDSTCRLKNCAAIFAQHSAISTVFA
jgi:hypothetical protein